MSFAEASSITATGDSWRGFNPEGWDIVGITNGGFLMAQAARAAAAETTGRIPLSVTSQFLNPVRPGEVDIEVTSLKEGRNLSMLRSITSQGGRVAIQTTSVLENPDRSRHESTLITRPRPNIPPPDECVQAEPAVDAPFPPPFVGMVDLRLHPEDIAANLEVPRIRGWFRLKDGESMDVFAVLLCADAFMPPIFNTDLPVGWTPTVELAVQVRMPNPSGWLQCEFTSRFVTDGLLEEDGEIWDEAGRLVALSRQLALVPRG